MAGSENSSPVAWGKGVPAASGHQYNPGLDGLRAIAVSLVWLCHLRVPGFANGAIGVDIFFVLSGYLITGVLAGEYRRNGRIDLRNFYIRRALRLTPALWLLFAVTLCWYLVDHRVRPGVLGAVAISASYLMNWNRIFGWTGEAFLGHTWSLSIEEQFYLIFPAMLILLPRRYWASAALLGAGASAMWLMRLGYRGADINRVYNGFDCRTVGLLLGASCALLTDHVRARASAYLPVIGAAAVTCMSLLLFFSAMQQTREFAFFTVAASILAAGLIVAIDGGWGKRLLSLKPVVMLGRYSYGVYLWHYPLIGAVAFYHLSTAWLAASVPATIAIASLSFHFVERPILRLKSRFEGRSVQGADDAAQPDGLYAQAGLTATAH